jgi:Ca2+-binding RTX toxin-like protein
VAAVVWVFGLLGASGAYAASTIDYDRAGGTMTITGTAGEEDVLLAHEGNAPGLVQVSDFNGSKLTSAAVAAGCVENEPMSDFKCPRPARIVAHLGAGNDELGVYESDPPFTVPLEVHGGAGGDRLDGASGPDVLHGGDGDDHLTGRDGDDQLFGQDGNDTINGDFGSDGPGGHDHLDGGAGDDQFEQYVGFGYPASLKGNDTYVGGPGNDSFSYFHRADPVTISLDGIANDGLAGELDNIHPDIETVGGGPGNDLIVGSPGPDRLWGGDGGDVIHGGAGDDWLSGDDGDDVIDGGAGNDELIGGCMTDRLVGGPGSDTFFSDASPSSVCGYLSRSPLDRIEAADGERDALIFCQVAGDPAGDTAVVDAIDPVAGSGAGACATISSVGAPSGGGGGPVPGGGATPATPLQGKRRAVLGSTLTLLTGTGRPGQAASLRIDLKRKRLTLGTLRATSRTKVATAATMRHRGRTVTLGRVTVTVKAGTTRTLQLRLSASALRVLKGHRTARVSATFRIGKKSHRKVFNVAVARK